MKCLSKGITAVCKKITLFSSYHRGEHFERDLQGNIIGTIEDDEKLYNDLIDRFDLSLMKYPHHDILDKMTRSIFSPMDCVVISHVKTGPTHIHKLAKTLRLSEEEAEEIFHDICYRGLLLCVEHIGNNRYLLLPEYAIGWYETSMRYVADNPGKMEKFDSEHDDIDWVTLMEYYRKYWDMISADQDPKRGIATIMRGVPYDIDEDEPHYVSTYETAKGLILDSPQVALTTCVCKYHELVKTGEELPEEYPLKCCIVANDGYDPTTKLGYAEPCSHEEALKLLKHCHDNDHMTHVDNSKKPFIICCCHKDYCGILHTYYNTGRYPAHPSKFLPVFDDEKCIGCGVCVKRCPSNVLELVDNPNAPETSEKSTKKKKRVKKIVRFNDPDNNCIGCLSCQYGCKVDAISYIEREEDVYDAPNDYFEWVVRMAYDRDNLHILLFDNPQSKIHKFLRKIAGNIEESAFIRGIKFHPSLENFLVKSISEVAKLKIFHGL